MTQEKTLHMTKVAYGMNSLSELIQAVERRAQMDPLTTDTVPTLFMTTRYLPKRHAEILNGGSLYWIIKHQVVARAKIIRFDPTPDGRHDIVLEARPIAVRPIARRAHQGWRYLDGADAPEDIGGDTLDGETMPADLASALANLSLL
jgi:hypothetical protein